MLHKPNSWSNKSPTICLNKNNGNLKRERDWFSDIGYSLFNSSFGLMNIIICPGMHEPELTQSFINGLLEQIPHSSLKESVRHQILVFPAQHFPAYSGFHILQFLGNATQYTESQICENDSDARGFNRSVSPIPLIFICFSAGVAGAITAAWTWQLLGGSVKALIALDGWGVPLTANFPIHRLSHDYFTHWSSALLGSGADSFYADPPVTHLDLWRKPQKIRGWWVHSDCGIPLSGDGAVVQTAHSPITAAHFLTMLLERYGGEL